MTVRILQGDCRDVLRSLPAESVHCVVTSPPYFGLRDYGVDGQIGLEPTPDAFVAEMVAVFREVRRVLRSDGTLWLNLGDSYASAPGQGTRGGPPSKSSTLEGNGHKGGGPKLAQLPRVGTSGNKGNHAGDMARRPFAPGLKPKDLIGIPWHVAFAIQADGWWLRQDIIWSKPNPMPESVTDRCTKAHEYVFLFAKSGAPTIWRHRDTRLWTSGRPAPDYRWRHRKTSEETAVEQPGEDWTRINLWRSFDYFFDADAVAEARTQDEDANGFRGGCYVGGETNNATLGKRRVPGNKRHKHATAYEQGDLRARTKVGLVAYADREREADPTDLGTRNKRSVWTVGSAPFAEAHFATFPPALIEPAILAGCPKGGVVLDPFGGAGTTGLVADRLGRDAILIELNPEYAAMAERRIKGDANLLSDVRLESPLPAEARGAS